MQDELRSQASALSQESMQGGALNVIRFNTFDEILFTMLYTFHKFFWLLFRMLEFLGIGTIGLCEEQFTKLFQTSSVILVSK
ncbi:MAG: hypothetical protein EZS28_015305 [Streblomastix strix]|uniref:Uncharacterized protein n=1 Tax=Streblomastix strix TaxID=222440 RepID=A0A5J4W3L9_9EUKA|nr:MAG: hypothetical protein EZS28_015305 [Streblomastix strix]